jgi:hypothetical protein
VSNVQASWREQDIVLNDNSPTEVYFRETEPNHIVIANPTTNPMYIGESANVSPSFHEMSIPSGGFKMYAKPKGMKRIYIWHADAGEDKVHIVSFTDDFNPQSIAQTQETVTTQQMTGTMDISSLPPTPEGNNHIGEVAVNELPSLPGGTNNIGKVDINSLPAIDQLAYTSQHVTAVQAGDVTVKNSGGKVIGLYVEGTVNVILKDNNYQVWGQIAGGSQVLFPFPVLCNTSIVLTFDGSGEAYILYN